MAVLHQGLGEREPDGQHHRVPRPKPLPEDPNHLRKPRSRGRGGLYVSMEARTRMCKGMRPRAKNRAALRLGFEWALGRRGG